MSIQFTLLMSITITLLGLMVLFAVAFLPLDWKESDGLMIEAAQSFARFFVFSALIGGCVVGLYKVSFLMVKHL